MPNFKEVNSSEDRVYTMVNRQALSTWLQTWTIQLTDVTPIRSLRAGTEGAQKILKSNPKELGRK